MSVETRFLQSTIDCSTGDCARECARYQVAFQPAAYDDSLFGHLGVCYPQRLDRAVAKRRAEFLAGRYAVKHCYNALGEQPLSVDLALGSGVHGEPRWPDHLVGSITHTRNLACAIVASAKQYEGIGVDIERWIDAERFDSVKEQILSTDEARWLAGQGRPLNESGTMVFSAKESLFKALYPVVGKYFDFHEAQIIDLNHESSELQLRLLRTLSSNDLAQEGRVFTVEFTAAKDTVHTQLLLRRSE